MLDGLPYGIAPISREPDLRPGVPFFEGVFRRRDVDSEGGVFLPRFTSRNGCALPLAEELVSMYRPSSRARLVLHFGQGLRWLR